MSKKFLLPFFALMQMSSFAQVFDVDTILWNGNSSNKVNLVIMGDGYISTEQSKFISDATKVSDAFFTTSPYKEYKNYFNVIAIKVISNQSGANHPKNSSDGCGSMAAATVDNYFGSSFDCGGGYYHRLLCVTKSSNIYSVLAANWPDYDQALILTNSAEYGGAGGSFAVSSVNASATEIAIHEVGHSFGILADEYWAGSMYATNSKPNMTNNSNISTVKWASWVGTNTVGLYPHSGDPTWFKPVTGKCKMEVLGVQYPFCPVCREALLLKILDLAKPYDGFTPSNSGAITPGGNLDFNITTVLPNPNTLEIKWLLNGNTLSTGTASTYNIPIASLVPGTNTVQARLFDNSSYLKSTSHTSNHVYLFTWSINSVVTGTTIVPSSEKLSYSLFPNPNNGISTFSYELENEGNITVQLFDISGKNISLLNEVKQNMGTHQIQINNAELNLAPGIYFLKLSKDGVLLADEKLVVE